MFEGMLGGLAYLTNPAYWFAVIAAVLLAALTGVIPGFSSILVMALAIPFIIMNIQDPVIGLVLLATITGVNNTLDSIPAVLLGNPGAATQVTFLEGNQLARKGYAAHTLGGIYVVSAIGGVVGALVLAIIIPLIRPVVLRVSYPEITALALFGVAMVATLSRGAMLKGIIAGLVGILLGTMGLDPITATPRYTFGQLELWGGLPLIATTLGVFALPEMIDLTMTRRAIAPPDSKVSTREVMRGARDGVKRWPIAVRHSLFGVILGMVPGVGAAVIDWLSYVFGIFFTKDKSVFGKGAFEGVLFAESAQNAKEGGQAVPTLALGIPGGLAWALVLAGMLAYNIAPGPDMLTRHADLTIALVLTLAIANLLVTMVGLVATGQLAKLTLIPYPLIGGIIIPVSLLAAFTDINHWLALPIVLSFGIIGLVMKQYQWPRPPLILGFILGPIIERNFQSAYSIYGFTGFLTRPLTLVLLVTAIALGYFFYRMGQSGKIVPMAPEAEVSTGTMVPQASAPRPPSPAQAVKPRLHFQWREMDNLIALLVIAGAAAFVLGSREYIYRAQLFPFWIGAAVIVLTAVQLVKSVVVRRTGPVEIMDIGMRSMGEPGAKRIGAIMAGLFILFILLSFLVGLRIGTLAFAALVPLIVMEGKWRWIGAAIAASFVAIFAYVVLDRLANVIWPNPLLGRWLLSLF